MSRPVFFPTESGIDAVAANWAVRRTGGLTGAETEEFLKWIADDPRHAVALAVAERAVAAMRRPRDARFAADVREQLQFRAHARARRRFRLAGWSAAMAAAAAAVALLLTPAVPVSIQPPLERVATVEVRPDVRLLPDGSSVLLNAGADIRVAFSADRRSVELLRGEAHFSVQKDATRPFVVTAAGVEVRAVGTAFLVQHRDAAVQVLVTEGRVAVARTSAQPAAVVEGSFEPRDDALYVGAGGKVNVPVAVEIAPVAVATVPVEETTPDEIDAALAWRDKRVEFTATPLGEAVAMLNRENRTQVVIADRALAARRLSGIFWKDDPAAFATLIEMSFSAYVEKTGDDQIVVRSR